MVGDDLADAPKILDFGLAVDGNKALAKAQSIDERGLSNFAVVGSPAYLSPFLVRREVDTSLSSLVHNAKADLWSSDVMTYELLTKTDFLMFSMR